MQSADAPLTGTRVDLDLAGNWRAVGIDPRFEISVEPVEDRANEAGRVVWRDGQALILGSVSQTRTWLGLDPAH